MLISMIMMTLSRLKEILVFGSTKFLILLSEGKGEFEINLKNCNSELEVIEIPQELYSRPPGEFLEKVRSLARLVDVRDFRYLSMPEFRRRMLLEIERVLNGAEPYLRAILCQSRKFQKHQPQGLFLQLDRLATWRNAGEVSFELRRSGENWRSYTTVKI